MTQPTILVTGATGNTGGAVVLELLQRGVPVRAMVRTHDARSAALEARGAQVVVADMFDPDQLVAAMRGAQHAYYVPPYHPYVIQSAVTFAVAAREAKLEAIVQLGQWLSHRNHPALMTRHTWLMDRVFAELHGIAHTILNPGLFADDFLRTIDFATLLGVFPVLAGGTGKVAPVANEDIARTAVAALLAPGRHDGMTYRPTGPQLLSGREMADIVAKVVGHRVRAVDVPFWLFSKTARWGQGVAPFMLSALRHYIADAKNGAFAFEGGVTDTVEALTGTPAEDFETTARRYAALPFARQSLGNWFKALAKFTVAPLLPGYDLERLERQWGFPEPQNPTTSLADQTWRDEHRRLMAGQPRPGQIAGTPSLRVAS
jgi:NAD(P)H dehydrogenase (quinone)